MNRMEKRVAPILLRSLLVVLAGTACGASEKVATTDTKPISDSLRAIVEASFKAIEAKNADGVLEAIAENITYVGDGMVVEGKDSLTKLTLRAFSEWQTVKADVKITKVNILSPEIAVVNWDSRVSATDKKGNTIPYGGIVTAVFVNRNGRWQIVQQQQCAPMPVETPMNMPTTRAIPES